MQLSLPLNKVKEFVALSRVVETEKSDFDNLQVLKYVKIEIDFDICTITKANLKSFVQFTFDHKADDCVMIVLEKELIDFCSFSNREIITFTEKDSSAIMANSKDMVIDDGYTTAEHFAGNCTPEMFFKIPNYGKPTAKLPKELLLNLEFARIHAGTDDLRPMFKYIYIDSSKNDGKSYLYCSNMRIFFIRKFDYKLPNLCLSKEECSTLSKFETIDYCEYADNDSKSWNVYKSNNVVYGFRQNDEAKGFPYENFLEVKKENFVTIKTEDIINFCNSAKIRMSKNEGKATYVNSKAIIKGSFIEFICEDNDSRKKNKVICPIILNGKEFDFIFDHGQFFDIFKSVPFNEICISDENGTVSNGGKINMLCVYSPSDDSYFSLVSKLSV